MVDDIAKARALLEKLSEYDKAYFAGNKSLISDDAYDALWIELRDMARSNKHVAHLLSDKGMPVGHPAEVDNARKVAHSQFMNSLDKVKLSNRKAVVSSLSKIEKHLRVNKQHTALVVQPKYDGLSVIVYKRGDMIQAVSRGGGNAGEDVTARMMEIPGFKEAADNMPSGCVVRGEALIDADSTPDENAPLRNIAAGAIRSLQDGAAKDAGVVFIAYDLLGPHEYVYSEDAKLDMMRDMGFLVAEYTVCYGDGDRSLAEVTADTCEKLMPEDRFWVTDIHPRVKIDGLVVKTYMKQKRDPNDHHQFCQLAIKPIELEQIATIESIDFTVSSQGKLTPVAKFNEPVSLNGQSVQAASLGSWDNARKLGVTVGARVSVILANDVIPKITAVVVRREDTTLDQPIDTVVKGAHLFTSSVTVNTAERVHELKKVCKWSAKGVNVHDIDAVIKHCEDEAASTTAQLLSCIASQHHDDVRLERTARSFENILKHATTADIVKMLHVPGLTEAKTKQLSMQQLRDVLTGDDKLVASMLDAKTAKATSEYRSSERWHDRRVDDVGVIDLCIDCEQHADHHQES